MRRKTGEGNCIIAPTDMEDLQGKCRGRRKSRPTAVKRHERCNLAGKTVSPRARLPPFRPPAMERWRGGRFGARDFSAVAEETRARPSIYAQDLGCAKMENLLQMSRSLSSVCELCGRADARVEVLRLELLRSKPESLHFPVPPSLRLKRGMMHLPRRPFGLRTIAARAARVVVVGGNCDRTLQSRELSSVRSDATLRVDPLDNCQFQSCGRSTYHPPTDRLRGSRPGRYACISMKESR